MTNRFMISVAVAALIAGTGFANAQGTGMSREAPSTGSTVQQGAPSSDHAAPSSATPLNRHDATDSAKPAAKTTQSDEKMQPQGGKNLRAQDDIKAGSKSEKSVQAQDTNVKGEKSKSMSSETNEKGAAGKDMKAEGRNGNMNAEFERGCGQQGHHHDRSGWRRRKTLDRTAHQYLYCDQAAEHPAGDQRQLLDFDRDARSAQRRLPPAAGGNRHDLPGLAGI